MTDLEINETLAKLAGYKRGNGMWHWPEGAPSGFIPDYLHDANAVIALLNQHPRWAMYKAEVYGPFVCEIYKEETGVPSAREFADTFCRAACMALLAAHGKTL